MLLSMDGMLPEAEQAGLEAHLSECTWCREQKSLLQDFERDFHSDIPMPSDFTRNVMEKIPEPLNWKNIVTATGVAALMLLILYCTGPSASLQSAGEILSAVFSFLKRLPLLHLSRELVCQNMTFFSSYTVLIMSIYFYLSLRGKKQSLSTGSNDTRR